MNINQNFWYYVPIIGIFYWLTEMYDDNPLRDSPIVGFNAMSFMCQIIGIALLLWWSGIFDTTLL